jgi:nucleoside-diphosphate-sugar epimerase
MNKILITGAAGFIGANLTQYFVKKKYDIHAIVHPQESLWRLKSIQNLIEIHLIDLADFDNIQKLIQTIRPTHIIHLAAFGGMPTEQNQLHIYKVNFEGTINLINACKKVGFEIFINTGSSSEYGKKQYPMKETDVLEPISDYAVAKAAATQYCLKEALVNKLPIYTIRPFSVYGDYEAPTRLISSIMLNILQNKTIKLSNPNNVRDFIYIDDIVKTYASLLEKNPNNKFIFNVGTGIQSSIQEVVETIKNILQKSLNVSWGKTLSRPWEPQNWVADITQTKKMLKWTPKYSLTHGLQKTYYWFKKNKQLYIEESSHYEQTSL